MYGSCAKRTWDIKAVAISISGIATTTIRKIRFYSRNSVITSSGNYLKINQLELGTTGLKLKNEEKTIIYKLIK